MHYFIYPNSDSTLYEGGASSSINSGRDEILEVVKHMNDDGSVVNVSRVLIKFDLTSISQSIEDGLIPSSADFYLKLYDANPSELTSEDELYAYPVSQSWTEGSGKRFDNPTTTDGCSWRYRTNETTADQWVSGSNESGGTWYSGSGYEGSQLFVNEAADLRMDVTDITWKWLTGVIPNEGFMVNRSGSIGNTNSNVEEGSTTSYGNFLFFSRETHTIYQPRLEVVWDDSKYNSGSLTHLTQTELEDVRITPRSLRREYKENSKARFRINSRPLYPEKTFSATAGYSTGYTTSKLLPSGSTYYSIVDAYTGDTVIPFGDGSVVSADTTGNYFNLWLNGLLPERFYKIEIKVVSGSGTLDETIQYFDDFQSFKITR